MTLTLLDIISFTLLAASIISYMVYRNKHQKTLKYLAVAFIICFLAISLPDFTRGFINGFKEGYADAPSIYLNMFLI